MGIVKYEIFFFLLSKLFSVDCLQDNPTDSVQINGQNGMPNSLPGQSIPQEMPNSYKTSNPNPYPQFSNFINYAPQAYQPYNSPQQYTPLHRLPPFPLPNPPKYDQIQPVNTFQAFPTEKLQIAQPTPMLQKPSKPPQPPTTGQLDPNRESTNFLNTNFKPNVIDNFKPLLTNQNQMSTQVPQSYQTQSEQGAHQSISANEPSPKQFKNHLSSSLNLPVFDEMPDFKESLNSDQDENNDKLQEKESLKIFSKILKDQLLQNPESHPQHDPPPSVPSTIQSEPQIPSQSSSSPLDKIQSTPDNNSTKKTNGVPFSFQSDSSNDQQSTNLDEQGELRYFDANEPSPKQFKNPLSSSLNLPVFDEMPDFKESLNSDQDENNDNLQEKESLKIFSKILKDQLLQNPESHPQHNPPPSVPSTIQSEPQIPSQSSSSPLDKIQSTPDNNSTKKTNGVPFSFQSDSSNDQQSTNLDEQGELRPFGAIEPSPKEFENPSSSSLSQPLSEEFPDFWKILDFNESPDFDKGEINNKINENNPVKMSSNIVTQSIQPEPEPQLDLLPLASSIIQSKPKLSQPPELPPRSQSQLNSPQLTPSNTSILNILKKPQVPSRSSSNPLDKSPSILDNNSTKNINGVPLSFQSDSSNDQQSTNLDEQGVLQPFDVIEPSKKEFENPLSSSLSQPISGKFSNFMEPPGFGQGANNDKSQKYKPVHMSSKPLVKVPDDNTIPKKDGGSINSILGFPGDKSEQLMNDVIIDNPPKDIQALFNPENKSKLKLLNRDSQEDAIFLLNDINNTSQAENSAIVYPQADFTNNMNLNDDTQNSQIQSNESLPSVYFKNTKSNSKIKLGTANDIQAIQFKTTGVSKKKKDVPYSLEHLVFDEPAELEGIPKYDKSYFINTESPKYSPEDKSKNKLVHANPNDVHTLLQHHKHPSTGDNNYLLSTPSSNADIPQYNIPSFSNVNYVQQSNANKQLQNSFYNADRNPVFYNQIPIYTPNTNNYNPASFAVGQNQMKFKIQSPSSSTTTNEPSSIDNSGNIYKQVDLTNPSTSINSWSLLKKDYTNNLRPNQNNDYTSYGGNTRISISAGTPSTSYQNNIPGILQPSLSNDIFVQNMLSIISNAVQAPLEGTKLIFDVTRANFPRAPVAHIIRLTNAVVQSVMLSLQQTLNTLTNAVYGRRVKRNFNPISNVFAKPLDNFPGALGLQKKDYRQSNVPPTNNNMNTFYYNQPATAGQPPTADYRPIGNPLQQQQTYHGGGTDASYYGNNIGVVPQPAANTQNYVLNVLADAITTAIRSNVPNQYTIDSPEVNEYTQQAIITVKIVFKNQIDNILQAHNIPPLINM